MNIIKLAKFIIREENINIKIHEANKGKIFINKEYKFNFS